MEGRNALDRLLEYRIDNEVGRAFSLSRNEVTGYLILQLLNKKGQVIDQAELPGVPGGDEPSKPILSAYVDYDRKKLVLRYFDNTTVECDISKLLDIPSDVYSKEEVEALLTEKADKEDLTEHINDGTIHVTAAEKEV